MRRMVGRNVRRLRIAAGLSQAELGERMGVDRAYVSGLELGQRNPTILTLWHIAKALAVRLRQFFDADNPRRRAPKEMADFLEIRRQLLPAGKVTPARSSTGAFAHYGNSDHFISQPRLTMFTTRSYYS
jgi:transcriptional regulator with XRE-family HTH domain